MLQTAYHQWTLATWLAARAGALLFVSVALAVAEPHPFDSPLRLALKQREQFVRGPKLALAKARRYNRFNGLKLFGGIGANVDFRGGRTTMPQP
jgi:hypothetical protein